MSIRLYVCYVISFTVCYVYICMCGMFFFFLCILYVFVLCYFFVCVVSFCMVSVRLYMRYDISFSPCCVSYAISFSVCCLCVSMGSKLILSKHVVCMCASLFLLGMLSVRLYEWNGISLSLCCVIMCYAISFCVFG